MLARSRRGIAAKRGPLSPGETDSADTASALLSASATGRRKDSTVAQSVAALTLADKKRYPMLWTVLLVVLVLWALGFGFGVAGNLVHLLLVVAVVVLLLQLLGGRRVV